MDSTNLNTGSYAFGVTHACAFDVVASSREPGHVRIHYRHGDRAWSHTIYPRRSGAAEWDRLMARTIPRLNAAMVMPTKKKTKP